MREEAQLRNALQLLGQYKGQQPLTVFLKNQFRERPNMGSRDRRLYTAAIYSYYRLGNALPDLEADQRIAVGAYLSGEHSGSLFNYLFERFALPPELTFEERLQYIRQHLGNFRLEEIYPFSEACSQFFHPTHMQHSILMQPRVWIRVKQSRVKEVLSELQEADIPVQEDSQVSNAFSFEQGTKLTSLKSYEAGYFEVQDRSSQEALTLLPALSNVSCWDVCSGSGGKSLQLFDRVPGIQLHCTDVRGSILTNLDVRFKKAGVKNYTLAQADLSSESARLLGKQFDLILADVPCSGSGTWARNPDRISFFEKKEIQQYADLQKRIVQRAVPALKSGGLLLYVTCSVFRNENEAVVKSLLETTELQLIRMQGFGADDFHTDKLFAALLQKA